MAAPRVAEPFCPPQSLIRMLIDGLARTPLTWLVAAFAVAAACLPSAADVLQLDRRALASGQWWRIVSGHMVHFNRDHLLWDLAVWIGLGLACERQNRRGTWLTVVAAALLIPAAILLAMPQLQTYRGLSGLDAALFTLLAGLVLRRCWAERNFGWVVVVAALLLALAAKTVYELLTGTTVFVDSASAGFTPVALSHAVGGLCGWLAASLPILPIPPQKRGASPFLG